ncbi:hypothetical protein ABGB16_13070 [Micromonospora sp. B11E3]|uniref:hypothetical protein n=1 Tax=Micromonospora sp. B11E3 TaxID=3153562 RepID=UPI00325CFF72
MLLAHDAPGVRAVVVAFLNDSHALLRSALGDAGASVPKLLNTTGTPDQPEPLEPFALLARQSPVEQVVSVTVGLAPAGCQVETSADGRIQPDGSVVRSWQAVSTDGFIVRGVGQATERWRFTCDGVVRYDGAPGGGVVRYVGPGDDRAVQHVGPGGNGADMTSPTEKEPVSTDGARGTVDTTLAATAVRGLNSALETHGLTGSPAQVVWGGRLPDWVPGEPAAVLVNSCSPDGGCAALLVADAYPAAGLGTGQLPDRHRASRPGSRRCAGRDGRRAGRRAGVSGPRRVARR